MGLITDDLELIFSMLGEASTAQITKAKNSQGFGESKQAAQEGGEVAGKARKDLENKSGEKVVKSSNYLQDSQTKSAKIETVLRQKEEDRIKRELKK